MKGLQIDDEDFEASDVSSLEPVNEEREHNSFSTLVSAEKTKANFRQSWISADSNTMFPMTHDNPIPRFDKGIVRESLYN